MGHADKIRMQVRHIEKSSGKVYINSDSFLPIALLGKNVCVYSEKPSELGKFTKIKGTVEGWSFPFFIILFQLSCIKALGAIHFGEVGHRTGDKGVGPDALYIDFGQHGKGAAQRLEDLGVKPGDAVLMDSPLRRALVDDVVQGAYLDNGVGSFVTCDLARILTEEKEFTSVLDSVRVLFTIAGHEEIGRLSSRVLVKYFQPDVLVAVDVNHDYVNAPLVESKRFTPLEMGKGFTYGVGAICSAKLVEFVKRAAARKSIPIQPDVNGSDTGTDGMAGVFSSTDCAAATLGVPCRNMHTSSEAVSTRDIDACVYGLAETLLLMAEEGVTEETFKNGHVDLSEAELVETLPPFVEDKNKKE